MGEYYLLADTLPRKAKVGEKCDKYGNVIPEPRKTIRPGEVADTDGYAASGEAILPDDVASNYRTAEKWFSRAAENDD